MWPDEKEFRGGTEKPLRAEQKIFIWGVEAEEVRTPPITNFSLECCVVKFIRVSGGQKKQDTFSERAK